MMNPHTSYIKNCTTISTAVIIRLCTKNKPYNNSIKKIMNLHLKIIQKDFVLFVNFCVL